MPYPHEVVSDRLKGHSRRLLLPLVVALKGRWVVIPIPLTIFDAPYHSREAALLRHSKQAGDVSVRRAAEVFLF